MKTTLGFRADWPLVAGNEGMAFKFTQGLGFSLRV